MTAGRVALSVGLLSFVVYLGLAALRPAGVFWSLDEGGKYIYLENVLRTGDVRAPLIYPARAVDPQAAAIPLFYVVRDGDELYSWWPVAFPLLTLPGYVALGWFGLYLLPAAAGAAVVALSTLIVAELVPASRWAPPLTGLGLALTTPVLYYSATYWEHTLCAFGLLLGAWVLVRSNTRHLWPWRVAAALGVSLAVWLRVDQALVWAGLLVGWGMAVRGTTDRRQPSAHGLWLAGLSALAMGPWLIFNLWAMGAPFTRQAEALGERGWFQGFAEAGWQFLAYPLIASPRVLAWTPSDLVLSAGLIGLVLSLCAALDLGRSSFVARLPLVGYGLLAVLSARVLFEPEGYRSIHSLVLIAPLVALAPWAVSADEARIRQWGLMALGAVGAYLLAYYGRGWIAAGGLQWGPRYMLSLYPLLVIAGAVGLARLWPAAPRDMRAGLLVSVALFALLGLGYQLRGLAASAYTLDGFSRASRTLSTDLPAGSLITTPCTWYAMVVPDWYWNGRLLTDSYTGSTPATRVRINACEDVSLDQVAVFDRDHPGGVWVER